MTASPNANDTDLTGTVTVMGQTLTVTLGDPVGSAGTGWVSISGGPASYTFNPSQGNSYPAPTYCPQTVNEGGELFLTVGSQTFSTAFGSSSPAAVASALANQMNYSGSPLVATVSGSTITIKSAINGAATNYPLSVSYAWGPQQYFSGPNYSAMTSGSALTGGTD